MENATKLPNDIKAIRCFFQRGGRCIVKLPDGTIWGRPVLPPRCIVRVLYR